jgi:hypothetical protein
MKHNDIQNYYHEELNPKLIGLLIDGLLGNGCGWECEFYCSLIDTATSMKFNDAIKAMLDRNKAIIGKWNVNYPSLLRVDAKAECNFELANWCVKVNNAPSAQEFAQLARTGLYESSNSYKHQYFKNYPLARRLKRRMYNALTSGCNDLYDYLIQMVSFFIADLSALNSLKNMLLDNKSAGDFLRKLFEARTPSDALGILLRQYKPGEPFKASKDQYYIFLLNRVAQVIDDWDQIVTVIEFTRKTCNIGSEELTAVAVGLSLNEGNLKNFKQFLLKYEGFLQVETIGPDGESNDCYTVILEYVLQNSFMKDHIVAVLTGAKKKRSFLSFKPNYGRLKVVLSKQKVEALAEIVSVHDPEGLEFLRN